MLDDNDNDQLPRSTVMISDGYTNQSQTTQFLDNFCCNRPVPAPMLLLYSLPLVELQLFGWGPAS
jgi:hypothetical protein